MINKANKMINYTIIYPYTLKTFLNIYIDINTVYILIQVKCLIQQYFYSARMH